MGKCAAPLANHRAQSNLRSAPCTAPRRACRRTLLFRLAPASTSACTAVAWPPAAAKCRGLRLLALSLALSSSEVLAPGTPSSTRTAAAWPPSAARWRVVVPKSSCFQRGRAHRYVSERQGLRGHRLLQPASTQCQQARAPVAQQRTQHCQTPNEHSPSPWRRGSPRPRCRNRRPPGAAS